METCINKEVDRQLTKYLFKKFVKMMALKKIEN